MAVRISRFTQIWKGEIPCPRDTLRVRDKFCDNLTPWQPHQHTGWRTDIRVTLCRSLIYKENKRRSQLRKSRLQSSAWYFTIVVTEMWDVPVLSASAKLTNSKRFLAVRERSEFIANLHCTHTYSLYAQCSSAPVSPEGAILQSMQICVERRIFSRTGPLEWIASYCSHKKQCKIHHNSQSNNAQFKRRWQKSIRWQARATYSSTHALRQNKRSRRWQRRLMSACYGNAVRCAESQVLQIHQRSRQCP